MWDLRLAVRTSWLLLFPFSLFSFRLFDDNWRCPVMVKNRRELL